MGGLTISNKTLDKYFGYLKNLDDKAKKSLIEKLKRSINPQSNKKSEPESMFGAWIDDRSSDKIIAEIKSSRVEKLDSGNLE